MRPVSEQRADGRRGFWDRANPATWFRDESTNTRTQVASVPAETTGRSMILTGPTIRVISPQTNLPTAAPPAPAAPEPRRYAYLRPQAPAAGNTAAARPIVAQAIQEHQRGRIDAAIRLYQQALALDPAYFQAHQNLAAAYLRQGNVTQALAASERALALQPDSTLARLNFALGLERAGFPADAAIEAERLLDRDPNHVEAHLLLGNLYSQRLGQIERARLHYRRVIELSPTHPQSPAIRAWLADNE